MSIPYRFAATRWRIFASALFDAGNLPWFPLLRVCAFWHSMLPSFLRLPCRILSRFLALFFRGVFHLCLAGCLVEPASMLPFCWSRTLLFPQGGVCHGLALLPSILFLSNLSFRRCCGGFRCFAGFRYGCWLVLSDFVLERVGLSIRLGVGVLGSRDFLACRGCLRGGVRLGACRGVPRSWFWFLTG